METRARRSLWALALALTLVSAAAWGQSATKICIPVPPGQQGVPGCQDVNATFPFPVRTVALNLALVPLDVSSVSMAGHAVQALNTGHRTRGGWIKNPVGATPLCIAEIGAASGTRSAGNVTCITGGETYPLAPSALGVSVISADANHAFSGFGWTDAP